MTGDGRPPKVTRYNSFRPGLRRLAAGAILFGAALWALRTAAIGAFDVHASAAALMIGALVTLASGWVSAAENHPPLRSVNYVMGPVGIAAAVAGVLGQGWLVTLLGGLMLLLSGAWFLLDGYTDVRVRMIFKRRE
ncbi:hypothetical protein GCM10028775_27200 [Catellatospora paridis]